MSAVSEPAGEFARGDERAAYPCPACGATLFGWIAAHHPIDRAKIVLDRCEECGLVVTRAAAAPDVGAELAALERAGDALLIPNRASLQAGIGGAQWAELAPESRRLHPTPDAARLLLADGERELLAIDTPYSPRARRAMTQTLVNAFTLRDNFRRNARSGRLQAGVGPVSRATYLLDTVVTWLVIGPMAALAWPLERLACRLGRGGEMRVELGPGRRAG